MRKPSLRQRRFIERLNERVANEDRAALAALRRGLGKTPGAVAETHQYVAPWLPPADENQYAPWVQQDQDAYYLVASLFALHQGDVWSDDRSRQLNLGWSFRRLSESNDSGSIEKRFTALLNSHRDDLATHLQGAVSLLKEQRVNWAQLLVDIQDWEQDDRSVQRGWAQAYWGGGGTSADTRDSDTATDAKTNEQPATTSE